MRIPSFCCHFCLYPLVWRVSEEASYDNVGWMRFVALPHWVWSPSGRRCWQRHGRWRRTSAELSIWKTYRVDSIPLPSKFRSSPSEKEHNLPNNTRSLWVSFELCQETSTFECFERNVLLSTHFARSPKWRNPPGPSLKLIRGTLQKSRRIPASRSSWCLYKLLGSRGCLLWCWKVGTEVKYAATRKKTGALVWYWRPLIHPIV